MNNEGINKDLLKFIEASPTSYHTVDNIKKELSDNGFSQLNEGIPWKLQGGRGYFVSRNGSSLIAFRVPEKESGGFMIAAAHSDSPALKLKENPQLKDKYYIRLSTEKYGGMIDSTWLDRPLSVAGRIAVKSEDGVSTRLVNCKTPMALIPNVAIHLNRKVNDGVALNAAVDMLPMTAVSKEKNEDELFFHEDLLSSDLMLYNCQKGVEWGDFISAPRLDDLQCVFALLNGFISARHSRSIPVLAVFDNEEVGSRTKQGADSTFMTDVLRKLCCALELSEEGFTDMLAHSMLLSCDNAHGVHPNHPEMTDSNHQCVLNGGVVIKFNANQSYCTDGVSAAITKELCKRAGVPFQCYTNRGDIAGGSTLGNLANTQLSMLSADIGLAQLAMHSSYETAGSADTEYMMRLVREFFSSEIKAKSDGEYELR